MGTVSFGLSAAALRVLARDEAAIRRVAEVVEGRLDRRTHGFALMNLSKVLG